MAIPTIQLACVVVALDGTEQSIAALNWVVDNVQLRPDGGSIILLHVHPPPSIAAGINPGSIPFGAPSMEAPAFTAAIEAHQGKISDALLNRALEICAQRNVNVKTQVVSGDPKKMICEAVDNAHADLLVMGTRDYGRVKRLFSGRSISKYCKKYASCPVVVIKDGSAEVILADDAV